MTNEQADQILQELYSDGVTNLPSGIETSDIEVCEDFLAFNMHNEEFLEDLFGALMGDEDSLEVIKNDLKATLDRLEE